MQWAVPAGKHLKGLEIGEEQTLDVAGYGGVPIAFQIERVLVPALVEQGLGGILLQELPAEAPQWKDYDTIPGNAPADWPNRFDLSSWGIFTARLNGELVGGAVAVHNSPGILSLDGRTDLAVVWDLRVAPEYRRHGIGAALWQKVEVWAARNACCQLKVETQNTNVGACKFYARQGCYLGAVSRHAYPEFPNEIQLLWYKSLRPGS